MSSADLLASSCCPSSPSSSATVSLPRPPHHSSAAAPSPQPQKSASSSGTAAVGDGITSSASPTALLPPAPPSLPPPPLPPVIHPQHFLSAMADHFTSTFFSPGDFLSAALGHSAAFMPAANINGIPSSSSLAAAASTSSGTATTPTGGGGTGAGQLVARNSTKTLKCPKCNWHYKYQETLEIHMRDKHADAEVLCVYCMENQAHPKLARGETYSCGYKPYRCELCKYSTTTKGNLSIHMQSDKHLHAMQEMPQSIAGSLLGQFGHQQQHQAAAAVGQHSSPLDATMPTAPNAVAQRAELSATLQCLICLNFSANSLVDMLAHLERDRGQAQEGDTAALHGFFQCLLCPYSTNLKANFQLHTRTDKHIQRVQLINHLREGSAVMGVPEQFARLGNLKSAVQVRCQLCEEVFSCISSLREHCVTSRTHLTHAQMASAAAAAPPDSDPVDEFLSQALIRCGLCPFDSKHWRDAVAHANLHQCPSTSLALLLDQTSSSSPATVDVNDDEKQRQPIKPSSSTKFSPSSVSGGSKNRTEDEEGKQHQDGWHEMDAFLVSKGLAQRRGNKTTAQLQAPTAAEAVAKDHLPIKQCPLCSAKLDQPYEQELEKHIAEEHKIPANIVQRLIKTEIDDQHNQAIIDQEEHQQQQQQKSPSVGHPNSPSGDDGMLNNIIAALANNATTPPSSSAAPAAAMVDDPTASSSSNNFGAQLLPIFPHQCRHCSIAFRTAEQLQAHALAHSPAKFRLWHRCDASQCATGGSTDADTAGTSADNIADQQMTTASALFPTKRALERHQRTTAHAGGDDGTAGGGGHFCDICADGQRFASDTALMAHFNTEQHLVKARSGSGGGAQNGPSNAPGSVPSCSSASSASPCSSSSTSKAVKRPSSSSSSSGKHLPYTCNVCAQSFGQPGTLDTHLRSMAHAQRMCRLADLVQSGDVEPTKPVFEQPGHHPPQRTIGEVAAERKTKQSNNMGKLAAATAGATAHNHHHHHHHNHHHRNHHYHNNNHHSSSSSARNGSSSGAATTTVAHHLAAGEQATGGMPTMPLVAASLSNGGSAMDNANVPRTPASGGSTFDELFKPSTNGYCISNNSNNNNNSVMNTQQQQLMATQMMAHMFAAAQQQQQQQQLISAGGTDQQVAAAAAAAAATTLMATAQMAAHMAAASASGGFGFLDMLGQAGAFPKASPTAEEQSHAFQAVPALCAADSSPADHGTNGVNDLLTNGTGANGRRATAAATLRASAPPKNEAVVDGSDGGTNIGPPRAKRARAGSTPLIAGGAAPQQTTTMALMGNNEGATTNGSGRTSRESGADCLSLSNSAAFHQQQQQQQSPMDLMSVLQALATASSAAGAFSASSPTVVSAFGGTAASQHFPFGGSAATANAAISGASPVTVGGGTQADAGGFLMAAAAMAAAGGGNACGGGGVLPPTTTTTGTAATPLLPQLTLPLTPSAGNNSNGGGSNGCGGATNGSSNAPSPSPQKRARTRIADEQVKILRQYFDINNSPSEEQIKEMAHKAQLPEKVIKHWFRNTLFKERQRDKDSPYNFSIPPQMGIDLAIYHQTGEARIIPVGRGGAKNRGEEEEEENGTGKKERMILEEEEEKKMGEIEEEGGTTTIMMEEDEQQQEKKRERDEEEKGEREEEEEEKGKGKEEEAERMMDNKEEEDEIKLKEEDEGRMEEEEEDQRHRLGDEALVEGHGDKSSSSPSHSASAFVDPGTFLASLGNQAAQQPAALMPPLFPFFGTGAANSAAATPGASGGGMESFASMFSAFPFHPFGQLAPAASSSTPTSNGFSSPSSAAQQQQPSPFLQPSPAGLMAAAAAAAAGTNNGGTFGHLFSGQNMLLNSLMGQQSASGGIGGTASSTSMPSSQMGGAVPCSSSSSSSASVPPSSGGTATTGAATTMGSGRRANRTRFTDFQLRTLQQFFDKQAYPKDDDLEMLSKKMGLSPRVIVVWFQNARQKARKVFEQQPHLLMHANLAAGGVGGPTDVPADDQQQHHGGTGFNPFNANSNSEGAHNNGAFVQQQQQQQQQRFVRTPSANFQCVRCKLVFQRYLELVQHQQRVCFAGDEHQQQQNDNSTNGYSNSEPLLSSSTLLVDEQKQHNHNSNNMTTTTSSSNSNYNCNTTTTTTTSAATTDATSTSAATAATMYAMEQSTQELLRQLVAAHCHQNLGPTPGHGHGDDDEHEHGAGDEHHHGDEDDQHHEEIKHEGGADSDAHCYCAACDQQFANRHALQAHRCHSQHPPPADRAAARHYNEAAATAAGTMPNATKELLPAGVTSAGGGEPLDLSISSFSAASVPPHPRDEWMMVPAVGASRSCGANSLSPIAFSMSEDGGCANEQHQQLQYGAGGESQVCSPMGSYCSTSGAGTAMLNSLFHSSPNGQLIGNSSNSYSNSGGCGGGNGNGPGNNSNSSHNNNNAANKRFRTHLTPMQVFIMKSLFNDFKTPSMAECDALGQKIGLHKRVVQVWFQNARAKERKCAGGSSTGSGAESSDDTAVTVPHCDLAGQRCHLCGVEFDARLSLQEHIFSIEHVERVREQGVQMRGIGTSVAAAPTAQPLTDNAGGGSGSGGGDKEKRQRVASGDAAAIEMAAAAATAASTTAQQIDAAAAMAAAQQFPYELMYAAAAASGLSPGTLPSLLYDPTVFGTPVPALKIPKCVMQQILADMAQRREHTLFTQDGLELGELAAKVDADDFAAAGTTDLEVGWGCTQCGNVFQQSEQLQNHQKLICVGADGVFRLVQTHYQCNRCAERFGTQAEFQAHCQTDEHKFKLNNSSSGANNAASARGTEVGATE